MFEPCDLREDLAAVDALAASFWADDRLLADVCGDLFQAGGKRLRPAFVLIAARFGSAVHTTTIRLALATELLHVATLVHDDVVDEATARRHRPSTNARFGNTVATYAGGYLFAKATELFAVADVGIDPFVSEAIEQTWRGQAREVEQAHSLDGDEARCHAIAGEKTGALYELACRAGAIAGDLGAAPTDALARFGREFGVAFQLVNDVLDIVDDDAVAGKPPGSDLRGGIFTLPIFLTLAQRDAPSRRLRALLTNDHLSDAAVAEALSILRSSAGVALAVSAAEARLDRARRHLAALPNVDAREALCGLTQAVLAPLASIAASS